MLKDGTYRAWFRTPSGQGTCIAHLANGKVWGRDSIMTLSGTCEVDGERFTATITTKRHTEGPPTVFGDHQEVTLTLEGTCAGPIPRYTATAEQFPGVLMEGTLIFSEEQLAVPQANEPIPTFDPNKLPKLPRGFVKRRFR